ncbi:hypothetical protein [Natronocella acetinitrilica]|uniref:hypothetical protein n=1 Tax=Natronocella acetinitrilica TaxID=414046 RepID=UPI0020A22EBB|nr:hypothetical protein [Natronocella acetinitrilica]
MRNPIKLTTVGVHNYGWRERYRAFRDSLAAAGVSVDAYYKKGMNWHAKIFLLERNGKCILGIVGSSNVTRRAFGTSVPFNNECDVALWTRGAHGFGQWLDGAVYENGDDFPPVIRSSYSARANRGVSIPDRLRVLRDEVLSENLAPL